MLLFLAAALLIAWVSGSTTFHVASAAIHVLIALALVSVVLHGTRDRRAVN